MYDASHTMGNDIGLCACGDLDLATGTELGQQRVLRRLLTVPGACIWHLSYGAGLPLFVGQVANGPRIQAVTRTQMYREAVVGRTPPPAIGVTVLSSGTVTLTIAYVDATTQQPAALSFNVPG